MTPAAASLSLRRALVAAHHAKGSALTEQEWLTIAEKELGAILTPKKRQTGPGTGFSMGAGLSDDQWLAEIGAQPAFSGLNVRQEVESCRVWSVTNNCQPTRRRIVNWLLKALRDRPMSGQRGPYAGGVITTAARVQIIEEEPMNWREEFPDFMHRHEPWDKIEASSRQYIVAEMAKLAKKQLTLG